MIAITTAIEMILVGRDKTSLSWIGVPMNSRNFRGVLALSSYEPNAFNRGDLELLSNLSRHAALALENVDLVAQFAKLCPANWQFALQL